MSPFDAKPELRPRRSLIDIPDAARPSARSGRDPLEAIVSTGLSGQIAGIRRVDPLKAIIAVVVVAGVILIAKKSGVPMGGYDAMAVGLLLGIAALGAEYYLSKEATRAFVQRALGSMLMFAVLWSAAFSYGVCQWIGAASENEGEKARLQQSSFVASQRAASRLKLAETAAADAGRRADNLRKAAWETVPKVGGRDITTVQEAQALVDAARNHRWWSYTKECTEPRGRESQAFCTGYREALAAVPAAERREVALTELDAATKEHDEKRAAYVALLGSVGGTKVEISGERDDLRILMTYGHLDQQQAADLMAVGKIFLVSALLSGLGVLVELREQRGVPRRPWPWTRAIRRLWTGQPSEPETDGVQVPVATVMASPSVVVEPPPEPLRPMLVNRMLTDRAFARTASVALERFRPRVDVAA